MTLLIFIKREETQKSIRREQNKSGPTLLAQQKLKLAHHTKHSPKLFCILKMREF